MFGFFLELFPAIHFNLLFFKEKTTGFPLLSGLFYIKRQTLF
jgi:hypothetical protein